MSDIQVLHQTQIIEVSPQPQEINVNPVTGAAVVVGSPTNSVNVVNAGPVGPAGIPGLSGEADTAELLAEVDSKIATHAQAMAPIHTNATSGRDFSALFENGLI